MLEKKAYGGLDYCKIIAAFLVVAIHTSPLATVSPGTDFFLTRILARTAVPFFLMVSGYFVLSEYLFGTDGNLRGIWRFIKKTAVLYGIAILLYLPLSIYAGYFEGLNFLSALRLLLFDGTFYHLWYLPATILGALILVFLRRFLGRRWLVPVTCALFVLGLLGDSYFGLIAEIPMFSSVYNIVFTGFSYTRNGLFYAPVFLMMGAWLGQREENGKAVWNAAGLAISLALMTAEGFILRHFDLQRHDSMYVLLLACMFFLYRLALCWKANPPKRLRKLSTWIYILHPLAIVGVRGVTKLFGFTWLLPEQNSLLFFLAVCGATTVMAYLVTLIPAPARRRKEAFQQGRAWIELDRQALVHNAKTIQAALPAGCVLMPAVKAEAYGHGAALVSRALARAGIGHFCVATVPEGIDLRKAGVRGEILVLGYTHAHQLPLLRRYDLIQAVIDYDYAEMLQNYGKKLRVHICVDSGMRRLGERSENLENFCKIFAMKNLRIEGMFTHLCADDTDKPEDVAFTHSQVQAFADLTDQLRARGVDCPKLHLQASYGVVNYPGLPSDFARIGIALYGVLGTKEDTEKCPLPLRPVLSIKARVAVVKPLHQGEPAGYGLQFTADREMRIATVAIGYADGLPRALGGTGSALIDGCRVPIIGRVCMDQTMIDVTDIPGVRVGDVAVVIGRSGNLEISACDLAAQTGTITNEIFSRLGMRLERMIIG